MPPLRFDTGNHIGDAPVLADLPGQIPSDEEMGSVTADGACDTHNCHEVIADRGAAAIIPPRKNGKSLEVNHGGCHRAQRGPAQIEIPRPRHLAKVERIPSPKPRRGENALREAAGAAPHGTRL